MTHWLDIANLISSNKNKNNLNSGTAFWMLDRMQHTYFFTKQISWKINLLEFIQVKILRKSEILVVFQHNYYDNKCMKCYLEKSYQFMRLKNVRSCYTIEVTKK